MKRFFKSFWKNHSSPVFKAIKVGDIPVIKLKESAEELGRGAYGRFYNLENGYGIKVFHGRHETVERASANMEQAYTEFTSLLRGWRVLGDLAPRPDGIHVVKMPDEFYYPAMVVETIKMPKKKDELSASERNLMQLVLCHKLSKIGVEWDDDHGGNFTITEDLRRLVILDWGNMYPLKSLRYPDARPERIAQIIGSGSSVYRPEVIAIARQLIGAA